MLFDKSNEEVVVDVVFDVALSVGGEAFEVVAALLLFFFDSIML